MVLKHNKKRTIQQFPLKQACLIMMTRSKLFNNINKSLKTFRGRQSLKKSMD